MTPSDLPASWKRVTMATAGKWLSGGTPTRGVESYWNGDIPWVGSKDVRGFTISGASEYVSAEGVQAGSRLLEPGALLLVMRGMSLDKEFRVGVTARPVAFNQDVKALVPITELNPRFLAWYLRAIESHVLSLVDTASHGTKRLPFERLEPVPVPVPDDATQLHIVSVLDQVDALRRKRATSITLAEEYLRSSFIDLFGNPATNPLGWDVLPMSELLTETQYGTGDPANTERRGLPVLRMNNLTSDGQIDTTDLKWCEIPRDDLDAYTVRPGDLLFNRTNSPDLVGKTAVWHHHGQYAFAGYLIRVRFDQDRVLPDYISGLLNSQWGKAYLFSRAKPSNNMSNFSAGMIREIPVPVPSMDRQVRYRTLVEKVRALRARFVVSTSDLDVLHSTLLHRAFTGTL